MRYGQEQPLVLALRRCLAGGGGGSGFQWLEQQRGKSIRSSPRAPILPPTPPTRRGAGQWGAGTAALW